jgi:hypothetical protein
MMRSKMRRTAVAATVAIAAVIGLAASPAYAVNAQLGLVTKQVAVTVRMVPTGQAAFSCGGTDFPQQIVWTNAGTTNQGARP